MACGSDSQSGHAVALDELLERQPVAVRPGVVLARSARRPGPRAPPSAGASSCGGLDAPAGSRSSTGRRRRSSPVSASRSPRRSHCAATEVGQPGAGARPADRAVHAGHRLAVADQHQPRRAARSSDSIACHRTDRTFRSESRPRPTRLRRVGAVAPGPRSIHRFTVRSPTPTPGPTPSPPARRPLGHRPRRPDRASPTWSSSRARWTTATCDRLGAFLADPLLQTGTWDDPGREPASRSRCTPASPTAPPTPSCTPPTSSASPVRRGGDRRRIEFRAGDRRRRPTSCCAGSSPTR